MAAIARELGASYAFVERNFNLIKRYWGWEIAFLIYSLAQALAIGGVGFVGLGLMVSTLPLLFTERGQQMVFVCQSCLLLISGVYYPVEVMPGWMQLVSRIS